MHSPFKFAVTALIIAAGIAGSAGAGPLEDGTAAFQSGDYATALRRWRPLADKGVAEAQYGLGVMYVNGDGVPPDYAVGLSWFRKAAEKGHAGAQTALGRLYANGEGVQQDYATALGWFRKAAEQGYPGAQLGIGVMYENGQGVVQDYIAAAVWYRKAAEQGNATAQYALGILYYKGQGVAKDHASAFMWFELAVAGGDKLQAPITTKDAVRYRDIAAVGMKPEQIAEAQKRAREWKPRQETTTPPVQGSK